MRRIEIYPPVMNASGILSYLPVFEYLESIGAVVGAWVPKSIGPREKDGNETPVIHFDGNVLMNSMALPSMSPDDFETELISHKGKSPLIISHYGNAPEDYARSISRFDKYCIAHEINISCPNFVPGEKSVLDKSDPAEILKAVKGKTTKPVIAKLSPGENYIGILHEIVDLVDYVNCGNTLGRGLEIEPYSGKAYLSGRFGGISGEAIRPITTRMVYEVHKEFGEQIGIIAAGGISEPEHIVSYARAGASLFQIGTALANKNSKETAIFLNDLWTQTKVLLDKMHISSIDELVGVNNVD